MRLINILLAIASKGAEPLFKKPSPLPLLVPEAQAKEGKGMSPTQAQVEFSKALTVVVGRLFGVRRH